MGRDATPISRLFAVPRDGEAPVAAGPGGPVSWRRFVRDVAGLAARLSRSRAERWLIPEGDAYALAVGLLATLLANRRPMLPANLQPGHLADLAGTADGVMAGAEPWPDAPDWLPIFEESGSHETGRLPPLDLDGAEIILHTSGSTGVPLAVPKPLRCLEAEVASAQQTFAPEPGRLTLATVPPYHIYGLIYRVLWPLATNRPLAADTIAFPAQLTEAAEANPGGMLISSPAFLRRALPSLELDRLKACLGPVMSSGGPLPPAVAAAYNAVLSHPVFEVYGSTETGGIAFRAVTDAAAPELWRPLPGVEVKIDPAEEVLAVRSPMLPDDGWALAADRADLHPDGRFELLGRADRIVKIEEKRVSLPEVEQRLNECPAVAVARVILLPGEDTERQILGAVIEPSADGWALLADIGKQEVINRLRDVLKPYLATIVLPRRWRFVTRLPEDERGKTSIAALLSLFVEGQDRQLAPRVLERETVPDGIVLHLQLPKDLFYFDGHFDEAPILAGVVQIDWAVDFARENFPLAGGFQRIEALKFFKVLMAGGKVDLQLRYDPGNRRLNFEYRHGETKHSSGRVVFDSAS